MPSPLAHTAVGYLIYRVCRHHPQDQTAITSRSSLILASFTITMSLLPDIDAIPGLIFHNLGKFHNNITHSLFFGLAVAIIVALIAIAMRRPDSARWFLIALACYEIHVLMDFFTVGRGVMLFWPLTADRYQPPLTIFYGLHWSDSLISIRHIWTLINEGAVILCFWLLFVLFRSNYSGTKAQSDKGTKKRI